MKFKMFSKRMETECVLWYAESRSPTKVKRKFRAKYGRNAVAPHDSDIKRWHKNFAEESVLTLKKRRSRRVDQEVIIQHVEEEPKQSLRRMANHFDVSKTTVRNCLKAEGFRNYRPQIVQALKADDKIARVSFAKLILNKVSSRNDYLDTIMFSDEAIFHLEPWREVSTPIIVAVPTHIGKLKSH